MRLIVEFSLVERQFVDPTRVSPLSVVVDCNSSVERHVGDENAAKERTTFHYPFIRSNRQIFQVVSRVILAAKGAAMVNQILRGVPRWRHVLGASTSYRKILHTFLRAKSKAKLQPFDHIYRIQIGILCFS